MGFQPTIPDRAATTISDPYLILPNLKEISLRRGTVETLHSFCSNLPLQTP
jgi:hypothetical protein